MKKIASLFCIWLLLAQSFTATAGPLSSIVADSKTITWDPGVRGGIPTGRTQSGAEMASSSTAAQIQSRLNSASSNTFLKLASGTFTINATLDIPTGVTLRGDSRDGTILNGVGGVGDDGVVSIDDGFDSSWGGTARNLVSPTKGDSTITTSVAHGWAVGDIVLIDNLVDAAGDPPVSNQGSLGTSTWVGRTSGTRPQGQWVKIVTVPTTTSATIDPPLYWTYNDTPQGVEMSGLTHYAGVEDLTINNLTSQADQTVRILGGVNCWLKNVKMIGSNKKMVQFYGALWNTIENCWLEGGIPIGEDFDAQYTSDSAYGFFLGPHCTAALITGNIAEKLTMGIAFEGNAAGNVFSYNFITNMWWEDTADSIRRFGILMHGPHPFMNLVEGNWSDRVRHDEYWGTSSHFVYLRNRIVQVDRGDIGDGDGMTWLFDIERKNHYISFIGNVAGNGGGVTEDRYELINGAAAPYHDDNDWVWKIGYESLGEDNTLYDTATLTTSIRFGNWSARTNNSIAGSGIVWHSTNVVDASSSTPNSGYLTSKPSDFGAMQWPPFDPADPTRNSPTNLPAGLRYNGLDVPQQGSGPGNASGATARVGTVRSP
jgi:hypothetical protein